MSSDVFLFDAPFQRFSLISDYLVNRPQEKKVTRDFSLPNLVPVLEILVSGVTLGTPCISVKKVYSNFVPLPR